MIFPKTKIHTNVSCACVRENITFKKISKSDGKRNTGVKRDEEK